MIDGKFQDLLDYNIVIVYSFYQFRAKIRRENSSLIQIAREIEKKLAKINKILN